MAVVRLSHAARPRLCSPAGPLRLCRMKQDGEDVQPANESAGTLRILAASSGDWPMDGGKNSIYAPSPFSHSHLPIRLSPGARRPPRCERDEQTLSEQASWRALSRESSPHGKANGVLKRASHCSNPPFRLAIGIWIISDGSGPSRIRDRADRADRASLPGRIRSPDHNDKVLHNDKVHRYSTDHDVGSVMGCRDQQAILHCFCSRCARAAVVRPLFAES